MARKINKIDNSYHRYSRDVVAKPVDTYITPARSDDGGGGEYQALAASLAGLHGPLAKFAKDRYDAQAKRDTAAGEKLYNDNPDRLSYEDLTAQRELPHNPHMKRGYLLARASNEAEIVKNSLYQAYADGSATVEINGRQVNIAESDDPAAFDTWVRGFTNRYVTENMGDDVDPEIYSNVFMPQVVDSVKGLAATHIKHRQDVLQTKTISENTQLIQNIVRSYTTEDGNFYVDGVEGSLELSARISNIGRTMHAQGVPLPQAQEAVFNAVLALADDDYITDREQLLDIAKNVSLTDGVMLGNNPDFVVKLQNAVEDQQRQREQREEKARREKEREREEKIEGIQLALMKDVIAGSPVNRALMNEMAQSAGVKPQEFNEFLSYAEHIADSLKPKGDGGAAKARKKQEESEAELQFVLKVNAQGGRYTVNDVRTAGMSTDDQTKYVGNLTGDEESRKKAYHETIWKDIPETVRVLAFEDAKELEDDPQAMAALANATTEVQDAVNQRVKAFPALADDYPRLKGVVYDEIHKRVPDIKKRTEVIESELKKGTSVNDYATVGKAGQDHYLTKKYNNELAQLETAHNNIVAHGGNPGGTNFIRALTDMGLTVAEYEVRTGHKVNMVNKGQQEGASKKPFIYAK